jgi:23S rRNA-/tRNA-specific pseudouridylate synthase
MERHNSNNLDSQQNNEVRNENPKWVKFTHYSPLMRKITNIFQDTPLQIASKPANTISHRTKEQDKTCNEFEKQMILKTCFITFGLTYTEQNCRDLNTRYKYE